MAKFKVGDKVAYMGEETYVVCAPEYDVTENYIVEYSDGWEFDSRIPLGYIPKNGKKRYHYANKDTLILIEEKPDTKCKVCGRMTSSNDDKYCRDHCNETIIKKINDSIQVSKEDTNTMKDLLTKFKNAIMDEPRKTLIKYGVETEGGDLTSEGKELFLNWLYTNNKDKFMEEVISVIKKAEEKEKKDK